jgi:hypothetical protein
MIQNDLHSGILQTLQLIERANKAIVFHQSFEDKDNTAIANYEELKAGYIQELVSLLQQVGVPVQLLAQA